MFAKRIYEEKTSRLYDFVEVFIDEVELTNVINKQYLMTCLSVVNDEATRPQTTIVINPEIYIKPSGAIREGIKKFDELLRTHPTLGGIQSEE